MQPASRVRSLEISSRIWQHFTQSPHLNDCNCVHDRGWVVIGVKPVQSCPHLGMQAFPLLHPGTPSICRHNASTASDSYSNVTISIVHRVAI